MILSVIIPVYNEEKTIAEILKRTLMERTPKEVIVIDDGSTDGTWGIVQSQNLKLKAFRQQINTGKGAAVRKGIENATGDVLIIQDADLEYDPRDYRTLIEPILMGETKVVYGSRLKILPFRLWGRQKTPFPLHYLANKLLSFFTNLLFGSNLTDMETGYKMMAREVYKGLNLESNRFEIEPEITAKILKKGYQILEVPIVTISRGYKEGKKIKSRDALTAFWTLVKNRF